MIDQALPLAVFVTERLLGCKMGTIKLYIIFQIEEKNYV